MADLGLADQILLAAWEHELRDPHGRWTRGGSPGPFNDRVRHLYSTLPEVDVAEKYGHYQPADQMSQAEVRIVPLRSGEYVIDKQHEAPEDLDREELASYVAQAIGAPAPAVYRAGPDRMLQEYVPGKVAARYFTNVINTARDAAQARGADWKDVTQAGVLAEEDARDRIFATPEARALADLDYVITNDDRHDYNWMVSDETGKPVGIDHGVVMFDGMPSDSIFVDHNDPMQRGHPGAESPGDPAAVRFRQQRAAHGWELADRLYQVRPQFERLGHLDWFNNMMETPVAQLIDPADPVKAIDGIMKHWRQKYGFTPQPAFGTGWGS